MVRVDELGLRFNFVQDLGAGAHGGNGNRYRYQIVLPYKNGVTTGAGGAAGIGSDVNTDYDRAQYAISFQWHKKGMEFLTFDATSVNPEMPFTPRNFGGQWKWLMHDLGGDVNNRPIGNKWGTRVSSVRGSNTTSDRCTTSSSVLFHKREQFCIAGNRNLHDCRIPASELQQRPARLPGAGWYLWNWCSYWKSGRSRSRLLRVDSRCTTVHVRAVVQLLTIPVQWLTHEIWIPTIKLPRTMVGMMMSGWRFPRPLPKRTPALHSYR
jgi:hypothetical protein